MELFKWNTSYSVHNDELDNQHKKLFDIINELFAAFTDRTLDEKLDDIISRLHEYTVYHFNEEEQLLKQKGTPLSAEHLEQHAFFIAKTKELKEIFLLTNNI